MHLPAFSPSKIRPFIMLIVPLGLLSALFHLLPFLNSANPLGYDTGFYRRYLTQPFSGFPNAEVPGLSDTIIPRIFLDSLRLLQIPTDILLYGSYIFLFIILPILLFLWLKPHIGTRGALVAGVLLIFSPVQYVGFWYMLWKNAFALVLLLAAFISFERKWFYPLLFLDLGIALSHKTTAVIYLLTLAALFLINSERRREIFAHGLVTAAGFAALQWGAVPGILRVQPVAVFLDWSEYLILSAPLIALALFSIPAFFTGHLAASRHGARLNKKGPLTLYAFSFVSIIYPILHLPFFERIFIFSDIAQVALAAYGIDHMIRDMDCPPKADPPRAEKIYKKHTYIYFAILCIAVGILLGNLWNEFRSRNPLMSDADLEQISKIGAQVPPDAIILTTSAEAPWYEGWTLSHIAAPGMLYDRHNLEKWQEIWYATSTEKTVRLLNDFPRPLYISTLGDFRYLIGNRPSCVVDIAPDLLENKCDKYSR